MNRAARLSILAAYAAAAAWALAPAPPKPLAATIAPLPIWERPHYERPAPMPRPRRTPPEEEEPAYRGSSVDEALKPAALHPPTEYTGAGYYPHGLALEMNEEDHWAIANLRYKQLPPLQYDHPVTIPVTVTDISTTEELKKICHHDKPELLILGCASVSPERCRIWLGPIPAWTGITRNINLRHEIGHCNGWGGDHAGIR
jgi:hypothetical protein